MYKIRAIITLSFLLISTLTLPQAHGAPISMMMENDYLKVEIISQGGKISSIYDKLKRHEIAVSTPNPWTGLGKDRFKEDQSIPPELFSKNYSLEVVEEGSRVKATVSPVFIDKISLYFSNSFLFFVFCFKNSAIL